MKLIVSGVLFAGAIACAGWGASIGLAKLAQTTEGINNMEGSNDQVSPGIRRSDGPLYLFVGKNVIATCDEVYDSISVELEGNPYGPKAPLDFNYNDLEGTDPATGAMYVTKDCVPGSLGGVYSGVTVAATMVYAECKNADCGYDWFALPWVDGATWDFQYNITSASYGLSGIAGALVRQATENTLGNLWEAASNQFIGAFVCVLLGIGACVFMPGSSGSDSPGTELMS